MRRRKKIEFSLATVARMNFTYTKSPLLSAWTEHREAWEFLRQQERGMGSWTEIFLQTWLTPSTPAGTTDGCQQRETSLNTDPMSNCNTVIAFTSANTLRLWGGKESWIRLYL